MPEVHDPVATSAQVASLRSRGLEDRATQVERDGEQARLRELDDRDDLNEQEEDERKRLREAYPKKQSSSSSSKSRTSNRRSGSNRKR